ncbi:MAG TPA: GNAT family N-acetyltransferase [Acidobacteriaceae bacterium]|nr:GNAT family N-acetyltransferase [Acidobacteriaceae bacterium]
MGSSVSLMTASESTASTRARAGGAVVRQGRLQDAVNIFELVNSLSGDGTLLRRSYAEICENVRDFFIAESEAGVFLGCGALHLYGPHLAEVRSIVVKPEAKGQSAGGRLLVGLLEEAEKQGVASICLFTRIPDFFFHFGFRIADRTTLPDKIYKDCQACPRLYACDEVAMVRGPLPRTAVLGPRRIDEPELVKLQVGHIAHPVELQASPLAEAAASSSAATARSSMGTPPK